MIRSDLSIGLYPYVREDNGMKEVDIGWKRETG